VRVGGQASSGQRWKTIVVAARVKEAELDYFVSRVVNGLPPTWNTYLSMNLAGSADALISTMEGMSGHSDFGMPRVSSSSSLR